MESTLVINHQGEMNRWMRRENMPRSGWMVAVEIAQATGHEALN